MDRRALISCTLLSASLASLGSAQSLDYVDATGNLSTLPMDGGRTEVEHGDVNGDGHPDLVLVGDHGSPYINTNQHGVTLWLGDGAGGWTLVQVGDFGYGGVALGDVNGDGLMDVGYGVHHDYSSTDLGDQLIEVALGDGTGTSWTPWDDGLATNGESWGMFGTDFGDVDEDGDLDLGSNSFGSGAGVHVYANKGDGSWYQTFGFLNGNSDEDLHFVDFDGDGHLDLFVAHQSGLAYRGDGTGAFTSANGNLPASDGWFGLGAGDVTGNGRDEIAFVRGGAPEVWTWAGGTSWMEISGDLPANGSWEDTELADMDLDGRAELVAFGDGQLDIWSWSAGDAWTSLHSGPTPGPGERDHSAMRAGVDLDHNGYPDLSIVQDEATVWYSSDNRHRVLFESSTPSELALHVLQPSRKRVWRGGQVRFVDWTCAVPGADIGTVSIELSTRGPGGPWTTLASGLPNGGRHQLVAPADVVSSTCHLRLVATTASGSAEVVSEVFSILGELGASYCTSSPNSSGGAALISARGSADLAHEDLRLSAAPVPASQNGLFFLGSTTAQTPFGNGTLCVAAPQQRLSIEQADGAGVLRHVVDFGVPPASQLRPGDTRHLQAWFRDPAAGGASFDLSDGLTLELAP